VAHATKSARRYRYYVEEQLADQGTTQSPFEAIRLPAVEIEAAAITALRLFLGDPRQVLQQLDDLQPDQKAAVVKRLPQLTTDLSDKAGQGSCNLFRSLVTRITYRRDTLALEIGSISLRTALGVAAPALSWPSNTNDPAASFIVTAPLLYRRRGVQAKIVVEKSMPGHRPDRSLQQAVARARGWFEDLTTGRRRSIADISLAEGITGSKVTAMLELVFLAPELVEQIMQGNQSAALSTARLVRDETIPMIWTQQRKNYG
jgi:hypothetical protein